MADFQVKVEYRSEKFVSFFVEISRVYGGEYSFMDLCKDIINRCPSLSHLNVGNLRIRYEDDEGSYINLDLGDQKGFVEMWENSKEVPGREYRRLKIKASEINSPCGAAVLEEKIMLKTQQDTSRPPTASRRRLPVEELANDNFQLSKSSSVSRVDNTCISSPLERLFTNLENEIETVSSEIESKKLQLRRLTTEVESALAINVNEKKTLFQVCGQCHLREGHTKRNCTLGVCNSAKSCGMLDKHPDEKGLKRKLESDVSALETKLAKSQDNYQKKKVAYTKIKDSFARKVEDELIASNPSLYVQNNCKNWMLINKHAAILEKKCAGRKLPNRTEIAKLLKEGEFNVSHTTTTSSSVTSLESQKLYNPVKPELERHGIKFPSPFKQRTGSLLARCAPTTEEEERSQFEMMVRQSLLETPHDNSKKNTGIHAANTVQPMMMMTPQVPPPVAPFFGFPFLPPLLPVDVPTASNSATVDNNLNPVLEDSNENKEDETDAAKSLLALKSAPMDK